jgi:integrase
MPVRQRTDRDGWLVDFRWQGRRVRATLPSEVEALTWESGAKAALLRGTPLEEVISGHSTKPTPTGAVAGWTLDKLKDATILRYWRGTANEVDATRNAEQVVEILGADKDPAKVTTSDIDELISQLEEDGNSAATINRKLAALSKMLTHAFSRGIIPVKPHIERKRETQGRIRWFTREEEARMLDWLQQHNPEFHDLFVFLVDTGCRVGEACRVRWKDLDDKYIRFFETKGGRNRAVPITPRLQAVLARLQAGKSPSDPVWPGWDNHRVSYAWQPLRQAMGWAQDAEAVPHALRHTCASRLVQGGVHLAVVQQWLGHRSHGLTLRYAHLSPANLQAAVAALGPVPTNGHSPLYIVGTSDGHPVPKVSTVTQTPNPQTAMAG